MNYEADWGDHLSNFCLYRWEKSNELRQFKMLIQAKYSRSLPYLLSNRASDLHLYCVRRYVLIFSTKSRVIYTREVRCPH